MEKRLKKTHTLYIFAQWGVGFSSPVRGWSLVFLRLRWGLGLVFSSSPVGVGAWFFYVSGGGFSDRRVRERAASGDGG